MGRTVHQFEKEVSFKLGKEVENVMGHAIHQFERKLVLD